MQFTHQVYIHRVGKTQLQCIQQLLCRAYVHWLWEKPEKSQPSFTDVSTKPLPQAVYIFLSSQKTLTTVSDSASLALPCKRPPAHLGGVQGSGKSLCSLHRSHQCQELNLKRKWKSQATFGLWRSSQSLQTKPLKSGKNFQDTKEKPLASYCWKLLF